MNTLQSQKNQKIRILVTGATGQVGVALKQTCPEGFDLRATSREELDLSDIDSLAYRLEDLIHSFKPDFLVNAAAYTAVDRAESDEATANAVNAIAPGILAMVAAQANVPLLHYSTDYVFDGSKNGPYTEQDLTGPLSAYGRSKLAGERAIASAGGKWLILRTCWVFGAHGENFLKTMLRLASTRDSLNVVNDQQGSPTSAELIAQVTFQLIQTMNAEQEQDPRWGLYHLSAAGSTTWFDYARYLIARARELGFDIRIKDEAIGPVPSAQYPTAAVRPMNSRLDTRLIEKTFGVRLSPWQDGVEDVLRKLK